MHYQINQLEPTKSPLYVNDEQNTNRSAAVAANVSQGINDDEIIIAAEAVKVVSSNMDNDPESQGNFRCKSNTQIPLLQRVKPRHPQLWKCQHCVNDQCLTRTKTYPTKLTWCLACGILFLVQYFYGSSWAILSMFIILYSDFLKETEHFCSNCHEVVGIIPPLHDLFVKYSDENSSEKKKRNRSTS